MIGKMRRTGKNRYGRNTIYSALLWCLFVFCGCAKKEPEVIVIDTEPEMTLAEELAMAVSQNVIPPEAMEYTGLSYTIPEGFTYSDGDMGKSDVDTYVSDLNGDGSYICYLRMKNDGSVDYSMLPAISYERDLERQLQVDVEISEYTMEQMEESFHVVIGADFTVGERTYHLRQFLFVTDKYVFSISYVRDMEYDWSAAFATSQSELHLENMVMMSQ